MKRTNGKSIETSIKSIQSIKSNYHFLKVDEKIGGIFVQPPICASKQPPNLRQLLIRNTITANELEYNKPYGKHRCKVCKPINTATNVFINHKTVKPGNYNCDSVNVVYLIHCKKNAQWHNIMEKLAEISDPDLLITHTLSDKKSIFLCHCISMQMVTTLTISKFSS